jgi:hypothetical protein
MAVLCARCFAWSVFAINMTVLIRTTTATSDTSIASMTDTMSTMARSVMFVPFQDVRKALHSWEAATTSSEYDGSAAVDKMPPGTLLKAHPRSYMVITLRVVPPRADNTMEPVKLTA